MITLQLNQASNAEHARLPQIVAQPPSRPTRPLLALSSSTKKPSKSTQRLKYSFPPPPSKLDLKNFPPHKLSHFIFKCQAGLGIFCRLPLFFCANPEFIYVWPISTDKISRMSLQICAWRFKLKFWQTGNWSDQRNQNRNRYVWFWPNEQNRVLFYAQGLTWIKKEQEQEQVWFWGENKTDQHTTNLIMQKICCSLNLQGSVRFWEKEHSRGYWQWD